VIFLGVVDRVFVLLKYVRSVHKNLDMGNMNRDNWQHIHVPIVSLVLVILLIILQDSESKLFEYVDYTFDSELGKYVFTRKTFEQLMKQYFGVAAQKHEKYFPAIVLAWLSLILVEASMGPLFTLFLAGVAFVGFAATQYIRGAGNFLHYCCSSYAFWTFVGANLANASRFIFSNVSRLPQPIRILLRVFAFIIGPTLIAAMVAYEQTLLHHAFPFLIGYVTVVTVVLLPYTTRIGTFAQFRDLYAYLVTKSKSH